MTTRSLVPYLTVRLLDVNRRLAHYVEQASLAPDPTWWPLLGLLQDEKRELEEELSWLRDRDRESAA